MSETCTHCGSPYDNGNRCVYRGLCLKCYNDATLPCDRCGADMGPETHRTNDGHCFDCFAASLNAAEPADRSPALESLQQEVPHQLPDEYLAFLREHDGHQRYEHRSMAGKSWYLASIAPEHQPSLSGPCLMDNQTPYHQMLTLHAEILRDTNEKDNVPLHASIKKYGLDRLGQGFAIGEENSDLLFLDPTDELSLWCFYHDGEIQRVSDSFGKWFAKAKKHFKPIRRTAKSHERAIADYVGYWAPITESKIIVGHLPISHYLFAADGRAKCIYIDRQTRQPVSEAYGIWRLYGKDKLGFQRDEEGKFIRLPDGTIREDENPDFRCRARQAAGSRDQIAQLPRPDGGVPISLIQYPPAPDVPRTLSKPPLSRRTTHGNRRTRHHPWPTGPNTNAGAM